MATTGGDSEAKVITPFCGDELSTQFKAFLGDDFNPQGLRHDLQQESLYREARSAVQNFIPSSEVRIAQRAVSAYVKADWVPDVDDFAEEAGYSLEIDRFTSPPRETAAIHISPNALRAFYKPIHIILEEFAAEAITPEELRNRALHIACRGVYSEVLAQFLVKRHALSEIEQGKTDTVVSIPEKIDALYLEKFGQDGIKDWAVRLDRLAMCLGGAIMYRQAALQMGAFSGEWLPRGLTTSTLEKMLRLYAKGQSDRAKPVDQQEISFALVNAFTQTEGARFMKLWFSNFTEPNPPTLKAV